MRRALLLLVTAVLVAAAPAQADEVLVVGDSLEVGTGPHLRSALAGESVRVDAETGRPSGVGVKVLGQRLEPGDDVVVFDLGVNDDPAAPQRLASDLQAAGRLAGERCMVVATVSRPPLNGVPDTGLNDAIESFAASRENTEVADWRSIARGQPEVMNADKVHPKPAGYELRAQVVADAVRACIEGGRSAKDAESEDSGGSSPARKRKKRQRKRSAPVSGLGLEVQESIEFASGLEGDLLLPSGRPPYRAVVMLPGSGDATREELRPEAEYLSEHGIAALIFDRRKGDPGYERLTADTRAAVRLLKKRDDVRSVALYGFGEGGLIAARAAAGNRDVYAVVAVSPPGLPELARHEWAIRTALDASGTSAVTTMFRLAASAHEGDLTYDPADAWRNVTQPVLAVWGGRDRTLPARESADALRHALDGRAAFVVQPQAGHRVSALKEAAAFLKKPRSGQTPLPRTSGSTRPRDVTKETALASTPVQGLWLAVPIVLLLVAAVRGTRRTLLAALPAALALVALGLALFQIDRREGDVALLAGMPAGLVIAALLATGGAVLAALAARTAPLVGAAGATWVALAAYWLL